MDQQFATALTLSVQSRACLNFRNQWSQGVLSPYVVFRFCFAFVVLCRVCHCAPQFRFFFCISCPFSKNSSIVLNALAWFVFVWWFSICCLNLLFFTFVLAVCHTGVLLFVHDLDPKKTTPSKNLNTTIKKPEPRTQNSKPKTLNSKTEQLETKTLKPKTQNLKLTQIYT